MFPFNSVMTVSPNVPAPPVSIHFAKRLRVPLPAALGTKLPSLSLRPDSPVVCTVPSANSMPFRRADGPGNVEGRCWFRGANAQPAILSQTHLFFVSAGKEIAQPKRKRTTSSGNLPIGTVVRDYCRCLILILTQHGPEEFSSTGPMACDCCGDSCALSAAATLTSLSPTVTAPIVCISLPATLLTVTTQTLVACRQSLGLTILQVPVEDIAAANLVVKTVSLHWPHRLHMHLHD
jgi:hypothetical protein